MTELLAAPPAIRILHVEDEVLNRSLVRAILERAADPRLRSAIVDEAPNIVGARSLLAQHWPDVVLLDVRLPDGNGLDLLREIRADGGSMHVVVMSASVLASERGEAIRAGCDAFVGKPYTAAQLTDVLGRILFGSDGAGVAGGETA